MYLWSDYSSREVSFCRAEFTADFSEIINRSQPKRVDLFIHSEIINQLLIVSTSTLEETVKR